MPMIIFVHAYLSRSFFLIKKNHKIKANTPKATESLHGAKISETRFAQTLRFFYAPLGFRLTLSTLGHFKFIYCLQFINFSLYTINWPNERGVKQIPN